MVDIVEAVDAVKLVGKIETTDIVEVVDTTRLVA